MKEVTVRQDKGYGRVIQINTVQTKGFGKVTVK
jgi:hypothetical protein